MGKCTNHPEKETIYHCLKHDIYLCQECLHCIDPEIYCKHRTSCTLWYIHKEQKREKRQRGE